MNLFCIVIGLNVFENFLSILCSWLKMCIINQLPIRRFIKLFHHRIIIKISFTTHAGPYTDLTKGRIDNESLYIDSLDQYRQSIPAEDILSHKFVRSNL